MPIHFTQYKRIRDRLIYLVIFVIRRMLHFSAGICTVKRPLPLTHPTPEKTWHEAREIGERRRKTARQTQLRRPFSCSPGTLPAAGPIVSHKSASPTDRPHSSPYWMVRPGRPTARTKHLSKKSMTGRVSAARDATGRQTTTLLLRYDRSARRRPVKTVLPSARIQTGMRLCL